MGTSLMKWFVAIGCWDISCHVQAIFKTNHSAANQLMSSGIINVLVDSGNHTWAAFKNALNKFIKELTVNNSYNIYYCLSEQKIVGHESSRKSFAKEPQKTCAAKAHSPTQHVRRESAADEQMRITPLFSGLWHVVAYVAILCHTIHRSFAHKRSRPFTLSELNLDDNLEEDLVGSWQNLAGRGNWGWNICEKPVVQICFCWLMAWYMLTIYFCIAIFYMVGKKVVAVLFPQGTWLTCWSICSQSLPLESLEPVETSTKWHDSCSSERLVL